MPCFVIHIAEQHETVKNGRLIDQANAAATVVAGQAAAEVLRAGGEQLSRYPALTDYELASRSRGLVPNTLVVSGGGEDIPFGFLMTSSTGQGSSDLETVWAAATSSPAPSPVPPPTPAAVP